MVNSGSLWKVFGERGSAGEGRRPWPLGVGLQVVTPAPQSYCCRSSSLINFKGVFIGAVGIQILKFSMELLG